MGIGGLAGQASLASPTESWAPTPPGRGYLPGQAPEAERPRGAIRSGLGFVSEDRKGVGLLLNESIELNIAFTAMQVGNRFLKKAGPFRFQDDRAMRAHALDMIKELDIRCESPLQHVGSLSGGNQQKICVARALTQNPDVLLVSEPTRGIDVGAKRLILDLLFRLNEEHGMTVIMTSSELAELRSICDRIVIICEGKVAGVLPDASDAEFGLMMSGAALKQGKISTEGAPPMAELNENGKSALKPFKGLFTG